MLHDRALQVVACGKTHLLMTDVLEVVGKMTFERVWVLIVRLGGIGRADAFQWPPTTCQGRTATL